MNLYILEYSVIVHIVRQHKFCPDQKYNNTNSFPVNVIATEVVETIMNVLNLRSRRCT